MLHYNIIKTLARKILRSFLFISYCSLLLLQTTSAHAHPHAWIDVKSEILFNNNGKITGLRQTWVFDEFYTEFALQDFGVAKNGTVHPDKLLELGKDNLNNLKDYGYFTYMDVDKTRIKFSGYQNVTSELKNKRISFTFTVLLAQAVDPRQQHVSYRIYDPSYYIEMKHQGDVILKNNTACSALIVRPKPDVAFIAMAGALDKSAKVPDDLERFFAERVTVQCKK